MYSPPTRSLLTSRKFWTLIPTRSLPVGANSDLAAGGAWGAVAQEDSRSGAKDIVENRIILDLPRNGVESRLRGIVVRLGIQQSHPGSPLKQQPASRRPALC